MNKLAFVFVTALAAVMAAMLCFGYACGNGWKEVAHMAQLPWGAATLADVYTGLLLFCGWVIAREKSPLRRFGWAAGILLGGNLVACVYVLLALVSSKGEAQVFWRGRA